MADSGSKIMTARDVMNTVKNDDGKIGLYLMWGDEDFLIEQTVLHLRKKFIAPGSEAMDFVRLDFSDKPFDPDVVRSNTELPPWMSERRIVEVRNSGLFNSKETDVAESVIDSLPSTTTLVFREEKVDKKKKNLLKLFTTKGVAAEFEFMDEVYLTSWIRKRLAKEGIAIDEEAVTSLVSRCDKSMRRIAGEVEKLSLYCLAEGITSISFGEVDSLCPPDIKGSIFDITDAVGNGNPSEALKVLNNLILLKTQCTMIRFMLARHIRQLICVKELGNKNRAISEMKIHPYVAEKLLRQSGKFTMDRLVQLYTACADDDRNFKQGKIDERQSLEVFIVRASKRD